MDAADKRIAELLDRWMASVELHSSYLNLDDASYAKVQAWPKHQRPTRWIVDLARARLDELRRELANRRVKGDSRFADSLQLMSFLTTLLGSEHLDRFIPQATPAPPRAAQATAAPRPGAPATPGLAHARAGLRDAAEPKTLRSRPVAGPASAKSRPTRAAAASGQTLRADKPPKPDQAAATVIADAARLLSWGREWPQIAGLIARLADRPPELEVWAILRTHRAAIEARTRRVPD